MSNEKERRDSAEIDFDSVSYSNGDNFQSSVALLKAKTLNRFDVEINWYKKRAKRRHIGSVIIRWLALIFVSIAIVILDATTFNIVLGGLDNESITRKTIDFFKLGRPKSDAGLATLYLTFAGIVMFADRILMITRNYVTFKVIEAKLLGMRADFAAKFDKTVSETRGSDHSMAFDQLRIMASESFALVMDEIEEETKSWMTALMAAMDAIRARMGKEKERAQQQRDNIQSDAANAIKKTKNGGYDLTVSSTAAAPDIAKIMMTGPKESSITITKLPTHRGAVVPPGLYALCVENKTGTETMSSTFSVKPEEVTKISVTDDEIKIG